MFKPYTPTSDELAMVELQHLLRPNLNDLTTQEGLLASLVHDINGFDYYYHYSDDGNVWRAGEKRKKHIEEGLEKIEDVTLRQNLSACFNKDSYGQVLNLVSWGKYVYKGTKYVYLRWDGKSHEDACKLVSLQDRIESIVNKVIASGIQGRVIYSDNIPMAHKKLREGITWLNTEIPLMSAAVSSELYEEMQELVCLYKSREISYSDIRTLYPHYVEVMLTEFAEIVRVRNFYFMVAYPGVNVRTNVFR